MNKLKKYLSYVFVFVMVVSCGLSPETVTVHAAAPVAISAEKLTIKEDQSKTLTVKNTTKKVDWKLNTTKYVSYNVVKKNQISITGKQPGVTKITAVIGKQKFTCKVTVKEKAQEPDLLTYANDVSGKMTAPDFWAKLSEQPDQVLASVAEIAKINAAALANKNTCMHDLKNIPETYDEPALRESLAQELIASANREAYYANGVQVDKTSYFTDIKNNILQSTSATTNAAVKYAICTKRTELKWCPTNDYIGYSATDTDDEGVNSALGINEPMVIKSQTADGRFYWGYAGNCTGWVKAEDVAICSSKAEWLDAWDVNPKSKNFIVVTTDRLVTDTYFYSKDISAKTLTMGTTLKLAKQADIPASLDGRNDWHNYVVYLPTRDANGNYVKKIALIPEHSDVHVGYVPYTERNLLQIAFECLGNRYGWGGSLDAMDCSAYVASVYRCFGFALPRNTTWQRAMDDCVDFTGKTDKQKKKLIEKASVGSVLYFNGHEMMYLGSYNGKLYVISALGSVMDAGDESVRSVYNVAINTLDVKRRDGTTWLANLTGMNDFSR